MYESLLNFAAEVYDIGGRLCHVTLDDHGFDQLLSACPGGETAFTFAPSTNRVVKVGIYVPCGRIEVQRG